MAHVNEEETARFASPWVARIVAALLSGGLVLLAGKLGVAKDAIDFAWVGGASAALAGIITRPLVHVLDSWYHKHSKMPDGG